MTAFAPYNNPQVAVAMILENGGAGPAVGTLMRQSSTTFVLGLITTPICLRKIQRLPQRRTINHDG
ncbi:hypothetical protein ACLB1Q_12125 [Escherichia coli]